MHIRYMLHPFFVFGHLLVQTYLTSLCSSLSSACPPLSVLSFHSLSTAFPPAPAKATLPEIGLAVTAYIACYAFQLIGVFVVYELVYSFWRRWSVSEYCPHYFRFHVSLLSAAADCCCLASLGVPPVLAVPQLDDHAHFLHCIRGIRCQRAHTQGWHLHEVVCLPHTALLRGHLSCIHVLES